MKLESLPILLHYIFVSLYPSWNNLLISIYFKVEMSLLCFFLFFTVKGRVLFLCFFLIPLANNATFSFHFGNSCNFQSQKMSSDIACSQQATFIISPQIFPIKSLIIKDFLQYNLLFVIINSPLLFLLSEISLSKLSVI